MRKSHAATCMSCLYRLHKLDAISYGVWRPFYIPYNTSDYYPILYSHFVPITNQMLDNNLFRKTRKKDTHFFKWYLDRYLSLSLETHGLDRRGKLSQTAGYNNKKNNWSRK